MAETMVHVEGLHKSYHVADRDPLHVLRGVDLTVERGEIVAITGESGCGKSTLLHILGTLDGYDKGTVSVCGMDPGRMSEHKLDKFRNSTLGFIFQFHYLLPDFSARENVMMPALARSWSPASSAREADRLLSLAGLSDRLDHYPSQLSGGEQQRVAIARALINKPDLILADEPTGNLDEGNSDQVCDMLWQLAEELDLTVIIVTHNVRIAERAGRRIRLHLGRLESDSG